MSQDKTPPSMPDITVPYDQFQVSGIAYWIEANGYKPHLLVDTRFEGVKLPPQCMQKSQEVINIHSSATAKFMWLDDRMEFNARFGGRDFRLVIPYHAIMAMNFAGTGQWIPMPWTVLAQATGKEEVQITAESEPAVQAAQIDESKTITDAERDVLLGKPGETITPLPDPVHGVQGANVAVVDFRSKTRLPK